MRDSKLDHYRRAFLERLALGGAAAAAVSTGAFKLERLLWTPEAPQNVELPVANLTALQELAKYVLKAIERDLDDWPTTDYSGQREDSKIGHTILTADGTEVTLNNQYNVAFTQEIQHAESWQRLKAYAETAAASFASRIQARGLDVFAPLVIPGPTQALECVVVRSPRLSLRAIRQYDIQFDVDQVRFDILGGVSPRGARRAAAYNQRTLATQIKRRLERPRPTLNLPA